MTGSLCNQATLTDYFRAVTYPFLPMTSVKDETEMAVAQPKHQQSDYRHSGKN